MAVALKLLLTMTIYEIREYESQNGKSPFGVWFDGLKDKRVKAKIVLLLAGSLKRDQSRAVEKAKKYLADYIARKKYEHQ